MKQKTLLAGLAGKGIELNTRALARFTADNGVLVNVRCGRRRGRIGLPPKLLGLHPDKWNQYCRDFFDGHVALGQLTLVPKEQSAKLNQLDTRVRRLVQTYTINGSYMPLACYQEFKEEYTHIREEYLTAINEVAADWEKIRTDFTRGVVELVEVRGKGHVLKRDRDKMVRDIVSCIPTAEAYRNSAYMELEVRAFPTTGVTSEGLEPDLIDSLNATWANDVVHNAVKAIETCIGQVFSQACKSAAHYVRCGKLGSRNIAALNRIANRVVKMNVFNNPLLATLGQRLSSVSDKDEDAAEEIIEEAILDTVVYAKSTGIRLDMDCCPFTEKQLKDMLDLRAKASLSGKAV